MRQKSEEFIFIERIAALFSDIKKQGSMGIGDDCATIPMGDGRTLVVTCDMLTEGVHFLRDGISPFDLGYKSLAVNLSDVAAMGAKPIASFLSIGFGKDVSPEYRDEFMRGYHALSLESETPLLGGDTVSTKGDIVINVTALGVCKDGDIKFRSGASSDDYIYSSGTLGDSALGLKMILDKEAGQEAIIERHTRPVTYLKEAQWLGTRAEVGAMADISDGIASDLRHIMERSGVGAVITDLPRSEMVEQICLEYGIDSQKLALTGGEDYRLLFTVRREAAELFEREFQEEFGYPILRVGYTTEGGELKIKRGDNIEPLDCYGYIHL